MSKKASVLRQELEKLRDKEPEDSLKRYVADYVWRRCETDRELRDLFVELVNFADVKSIHPQGIAKFVSRFYDDIQEHRLDKGGLCRVCKHFGRDYQEFDGDQEYVINSAVMHVAWELGETLKSFERRHFANAA